VTRKWHLEVEGPQVSHGELAPFDGYQEEVAARELGRIADRDPPRNIPQRIGAERPSRKGEAGGRMWTGRTGA